MPSRSCASRRRIIAAGSQSVKLPFVPEDPRIVDLHRRARAAQSVPKRMLVVGGGIIGLEMGTVYSTLGARLDVVEMLDGLMQGADRDLVKVWEKMNKPRFDRVMLKTKTVGGRSHEGRASTCSFEGEQAPQGPQLYDLVLLAVGRSPNGKKIGADKAGVIGRPTAASFPSTTRCAPTCRTSSRSATSSASRCSRTRRCTRRMSPPRRAAGQKSRLRRARHPLASPTPIPRSRGSGLTEDEAKAKGVKLQKGLFPWAASGPAPSPTAATRASPSCCSTTTTHRIVGGGIVGTHAGDLISEIALAIEMGADAVDIGKTIHPHPTLSESVGLAAEAFEGVLHRPAAGAQRSDDRRTSRSSASRARRSSTSSTTRTSASAAGRPRISSSTSWRRSRTASGRRGELGRTAERLERPRHSGRRARTTSTTSRSTSTAPTKSPSTAR